MALTKSDVVEKVVDKTGFTRKDSVAVVESLLEIIKGSLAQGKDVLISGFGKFGVRDKQARKGRNPATGEDAIVPARRVVTFKCSGILRDKVNSN